MIETLHRPSPDDASDFRDFERQFMPQTDPEGFLGSLKSEGFTSQSQKAQLIRQIIAVRLPLDNYRSLAYRQNHDGHENELYLGSWGIGSENYGQFSVYELLDKQIPERRLGVIVHESAHANTPLRQENA